MVDANTDPAFITTQIVDAIGDRLALSGDDEIVHLDALGLALRSPLTPGILEITDQLFLLRIDRDDRLPLRLMVAHLVIEIVELGVPIRMMDLLLPLKEKSITLVHPKAHFSPGVRDHGDGGGL